jgi:predicted acylesterase/phospholipase RssA
VRIRLASTTPCGSWEQTISTGISGTSIGALNALFFAMTPPAEAFNTWLKLAGILQRSKSCLTTVAAFALQSPLRFRLVSFMDYDVGYFDLETRVSHSITEDVEVLPFDLA